MGPESASRVEPGGGLIGEPAAATGETVPRCGLEELPQVVGHVLGRRVPLRGPLRQRLQADPFQFLGDRVVDLPGRARLGWS